MTNLVFYRKYRPQTFSEVINQKTTVKILTNALSQGKISHAYLFSGPRGIGKTTIARLLAKAVNCANLVGKERSDTNLSIHRSAAKTDSSISGFEPCNQCEFCREINEGRSLDLIEIDAASNRGIDDIRSLRSDVKFAPIRAKYKIFIIDEAHQLTLPAFNALLKTLEEPPPYVIFILATTQPEKLPLTILSRVQRYDLKKLRVSDIISRLKFICQQENLLFEEEALRLIAVSSEGGLRDAESLLGQIAIITNKNITLREVEELIGMINFEKLREFVEILLKKDKVAAIKFINEINESGYDLEVFAKNVINYLRQLLLLKISPQLENLLAEELTDDGLKIINYQKEKGEIDFLKKLIDQFIIARLQIKRSPIPTLPLELTILEVID